MDLTEKELEKLIKEGEYYRKQNFDNDADLNLYWYNDMYGGSSNISTIENFDHLGDDSFWKRAYSVNLAYSVTRTIKDALYTRNPKFSVYINRKTTEEANKLAVAAGYQATAKASIDTDILAYLVEKDIKIEFARMKTDRINRKTIQDACIFGYGVTKQGFNIDKDDKTLAHLADPEALKILGLDSSSLKASDLIKSQAPYLKRIDPRLIIIPAETEEFGVFNWICQEVYLSPEEAKTKYGITKNTTIRLPFKKNNTDLNKKEYIKVYEFHWYGKTPKTYWLDDSYKIVKSSKQPIIDREGNAKSVFNFIWFNDGYNSAYPVADLTLVRSQIIEANIQKRRRVEHLNRFTNQYWFSGTWDRDDIKKLLNGADGAYAHSPDPRSKVGAIPKPELGMEFYNNMKAIEAEMYQILGLTDYAVGGATQERKATEAKYVEQNYSTRLMSRISMIDDYIYSQADLLIEFKKRYMYIAEEKNIADPNGVSTYFLMSADMLNIADPEIIVIKGSTFELDRDYAILKSNQFTKLTQAYAPVANMPECYKHSLEMIGVINPERFLLSQKPQPVPTPGGDGGARLRDGSTQPGQVSDTMSQGVK